ncbi:MAG TPA: hypothetical protein VED63_05080 [Acidimicrobiales bacterium]|nr:hypothetical protein [Acidimicrobiales bacterium]
MKGRRGRVGTDIVLVVVGLGVAGLCSPVGASPAPTPAASIVTMLPPGWELCLLQGVGAPVTQDNVADLDEWQLAEGGSTNNSAAYNPFNTRRMTDVNNVALPAVVSSNGFPAFASWVAGCAATVATILQPNMTSIVKALTAGDVSPPAVFLLDVDQSQWCAPSDGVPCYASEILGGDGSAVEASFVQDAGGLKDAFAIYSDASAALTAFDQDAPVTSADQAVLAAQSQRLVVVDSDVAVARSGLSAATRALSRLAVTEYVDDGAESADANLELFSAPSDEDIVAQDLSRVATTALIRRYDQSEATLSAWMADRLVVVTAVSQAAAVLDAAEVAETQALARLDADMTTIEAAGACTTALPVTAAQSSLTGQAGVNQAGALQGCLTALSP